MPASAPATICCAEGGGGGVSGEGGARQGAGGGCDRERWRVQRAIRRRSGTHRLVGEAIVGGLVGGVVETRVGVGHVRALRGPGEADGRSL
jgi:hypothetical protein